MSYACRRRLAEVVASHPFVADSVNISVLAWTSTIARHRFAGSVRVNLPSDPAYGHSLLLVSDLHDKLAQTTHLTHLVKAHTDAFLFFQTHGKNDYNDAYGRHDLNTLAEDDPRRPELEELYENAKNRYVMLCRYYYNNDTDALLTVMKNADAQPWPRVDGRNFHQTMKEVVEDARTHLRTPFSWPPLMYYREGGNRPKVTSTNDHLLLNEQEQ